MEEDPTSTEESFSHVWLSLITESFVTLYPAAYICN